MNTIEQLRKWCQGSWLVKHWEDMPVDVLSIDSRNIDQPEQTLFIALKTNLRDGHSYIPEAWQKGVRNFIISSVIDTEALKGANIIQVKDTLLALQQIAAGHRKQFSIPVIGITGSNGKTMVKEWLFQLLSPQFNIVRSPKSFSVACVFRGIHRQRR